MLLHRGHNRIRTEQMRLSQDTGEKVTARAFFWCYKQQFGMMVKAKLYAKCKLDRANATYVIWHNIRFIHRRIDIEEARHNSSLSRSILCINYP